MGLFDFLNKRISTAELEAITSTEKDILYFKELAFFIAKSYIANTISKCEIKTYEGGKEVQEELYYKLNINPNPNQNGSQFVNQIIENYYDNGEALVIKEGKNLYCADGFAVDKQPLKENIFDNISIDGKPLEKKKAGDVFYFKLDNTEVRTLVNGMYQSYSQMLKFALATYKRTNGKKYKLILENYKAGDSAFNEVYEKVIKKQLSAFMENENVVYPQFKGMDLQELGSDTGGGSSTDIIQIRKEIFDTTAQAFKIPLSMMYGNVQNMKEIANVYLSICIDPLADMISEELTRKTNTLTTWKHGNHVKVDTSCISHIDILDSADSVSKAVASGVFNVDELRARFDMPLLDTEFSQTYWITKNYAAEGEALTTE